MKPYEILELSKKSDIQTVERRFMHLCTILQNNKKPSDAEIREWLEGNICRCTGYQNIVAAVKEAASKM